MRPRCRMTRPPRIFARPTGRSPDSRAGAERAQGARPFEIWVPGSASPFLLFPKSIIEYSRIGESAMGALSYPATRYAPSPLVDLSDKAERERLSPSAIKGYFNIMEKWRVRDED